MRTIPATDPSADGDKVKPVRRRRRPAKSISQR